MFVTKKVSGVIISSIKIYAQRSGVNFKMQQNYILLNGDSYSIIEENKDYVTIVDIERSAKRIRINLSEVAHGQ